MKNTMFAQVEASSKLKGLNVHQIKTIKIIFSRVPAHKRVEWVENFLELDYEDVRKMIVSYNLGKMDSRIEQLVEDGKHACMGVSGPNGFSYSIGLCTKHEDKHELAILAGIGETKGGEIINEIITRFPNGDYPKDVIAITTFQIVGTETSPRVKIVEHPKPNYVIENLFPRIDMWTKVLPRKIYQIMVADINNLLPGEEGYDHSAFPQTVENCIRGKSK